jgi:hypothetical protein
VTDAEVVTLAVAQAIMDVPSDREFVAAARQRLRHLIPKLAAAAGLLEATAAAGGHDRVAVRDVRAGLAGLFRRCGAVGLDAGRVRTLDRHRSPLESWTGVRASIPPQSFALVFGDAVASARGARRHAPRRDPALRGPKERDVAPRWFALGLHGGELVVCDKGYAGRDFERAAAEHFGATILRPARKTEPPRGPMLSWIRQRIESIFWTLEDRLGLERHRARSLHGLRARIATKLLALAAGVWLNHCLDRPTRGFAALAA